MKFPPYTFYHIEQYENSFLFKDINNNFVKDYSRFSWQIPCKHYGKDFITTTKLTVNEYYILGYVPKKIIII